MTLTKRKYVVMPGYITSRQDGDEHYIGGRELMRLYGVRPDECYVLRPGETGSGLPEGLRVLRPRYDGDYRLSLTDLRKIPPYLNATPTVERVFYSRLARVCRIGEAK